MSLLIRFFLCVTVSATLFQPVYACAPLLNFIEKGAPTRVIYPIPKEIEPFVKLNTYSYSPGDCATYYGPVNKWEIVFRNGLVLPFYPIFLLGSSFILVVVSLFVLRKIRS